MNKIFLYSLVWILFYAPSSEALSVNGFLYQNPDPDKRLPGLWYAYSETLRMDIPEQEAEQKWECVNRGYTKYGESIAEWIPKNQNFDNRSELITIQFVAHSPNLPCSAEEFMNVLYEFFSEEYPNMQWNVIKQSVYDVCFEWMLPNGHDNCSPQHEITRIIWTKKGFHRVAYEQPVPELDSQTRELWLKRIESAQLIY
jgi:hypothetical protein